MARGGQRTGEVGKAYANRSDLAMAGGTSTHMAGGQSGLRGSGTSNTELQEQSAPAPQTGGGPTAPAPQPQGAPPLPPGDLTALDAPGSGGNLLDNAGRQRIFPEDRDAVIRQLYRLTGHPDLLELLERRTR